VRARDVRQACNQVAWPERPGEPSSLRGVGFRATVRHGGEERVLHDHWGDGYAFPPDFRSAQYALAGWRDRADDDLMRRQQAPVR
jgi:biotin carboxylase